jgi:HD superfamily phosphohydrolase
MRELQAVADFETDLGESLQQLKSRYELYEDRMEVYDIVWGDEVFEGEVFSELARMDALRRLQTVEQLTLPDRYKTITESTYFSRWEHAWGTAILTKRLAMQMGVDEATSIKMQLRALLSDVCHTAHSHAGDWLFQGKGNKETFHDDRRLEYAEVVGINELLRRHGYDPMEILDDERDGVIDAKMPDLDVDRVDYTLREAYRWVNQIPEYRTILNNKSFTVRDNKLVVTDKRAAKLLGISYVLLVTEHWQEPAHRLQLELFMESIKRVFVSRSGNESDVGTYSPVDLLMVTDDTLQRLASEHDDYMPMLDELMTGVSLSETMHRSHARVDRVRAALTSGIREETDSIEWVRARYDTLPRSYQIEPAKGSKLRNTRYSRVLHLDRLGKRFIDPYFIDDDGEVKRLSETDEDYRNFMSLAIANVQQNWRAAIIGNEASTKKLDDCIRFNDVHWQRVLHRPNMPNSVLRRQLHETVRTSNAAAARFILMHLHS